MLGRTIHRRTVACIAGALLFAAFPLGATAGAAKPGCKGRSCPPPGPVASPGEAPAPGVVLTLGNSDNPKGLMPLAAEPSPDRQLWPDAGGHEPYGFNAHLSGERRFGPEVEAHAGEQAGATLSRVGMSWGTVRYSAGSWDYRETDATYRENIRRGLRPLWLVHSSPRRFTIHADSVPGTYVPGCGFDAWCSNPPRDAALGDLGVFVADMVKRYPLSAGVEVWNEPNLPHFWGDEPVDPCRYARVLGAAHDAAKLVAPALPVLGGSMNNTNGGDGKMPIRPYLAGMLGCGAGADMDAVSWHPYSSLYNTSIAANSQVLVDAFADAGISPATERFVATELGFATGAPHYTLDEQGQADWLVWQMHLYDGDWPTLALSDRTDASIVHTALVDSTPDPFRPWSAEFGLVRRDDLTGTLTPRPAFCALRSQFGGRPDCPESMTPGAGSS